MTVSGGLNLRAYYVLSWLVSVGVSPIIGALLVVVFGHYVLGIPVGLGGGVYAYFFTPFLFGIGMLLYHVILYRRDVFSQANAAFYVWTVAVPLTLLVLWLLFTTTDETGRILFDGIIGRISAR